jgi:hypothetical protein
VLYQESLDLLRELGDQLSSSVVLNCLAELACLNGDYDSALARLSDALVTPQQIGSTREIASTFEIGALVARARGRPDRAAVLFGASAAMREGVGTPVAPDALAEYDRHITEVRAALGDNSFDAAWANGRAMSWQQAIAYALDAMEDKSS